LVARTTGAWECVASSPISARFTDPDEVLRAEKVVQDSLQRGTCLACDLDEVRNRPFLLVAIDLYGGGKQRQDGLASLGRLHGSVVAEDDVLVVLELDEQLLGRLVEPARSSQAPLGARRPPCGAARGSRRPCH